VSFFIRLAPYGFLQRVKVFLTRQGQVNQLVRGGVVVLEGDGVLSHHFQHLAGLVDGLGVGLSAQVTDHTATVGILKGRMPTGLAPRG
jgi:hypothetical protein